MLLAFRHKSAPQRPLEGWEESAPTISISFIYRILPTLSMFGNEILI